MLLSRQERELRQLARKYGFSFVEAASHVAEEDKGAERVSPAKLQNINSEFSLAVSGDGSECGLQRGRGEKAQELDQLKKKFDQE